MHVSVPALVRFISKRYDAAPGDVITTGTPAGIAPIPIGDEVTVKVEGIGTLTNTVLAK